MYPRPKTTIPYILATTKFNQPSHVLKTRSNVPVYIVFTLNVITQLDSWRLLSPKMTACKPTWIWRKLLPPYLEWEVLTTLPRKQEAGSLGTLVRFCLATLSHSQKEKSYKSPYIRTIDFFLQRCCSSKKKSVLLMYSTYFHIWNTL